MGGYELCHFGIKNQKWGVRRYQNLDGTYTEVGLLRRRKSGSVDLSKVSSKKINSVSSSGKSVIDSSHQLYSRRQQRKLDKLKAAREAEIDVELSQMDDKTLQQAVNRLNMERNYKSLKTADIKVGRSLIDDILDDAGSVLTIGASAATIALAIHQLRG